MNRKQKIQYFLDYYFVKTVVALVLTGVVVYLVWNYVRPQPEAVLYVALMDEDLDEQKQQALTDELNRLFGVDGKKRKGNSGRFFLYERRRTGQASGLSF